MSATACGTAACHRPRRLAALTALVAVLVALLVIAVDCSPARADGDPASDVLLSQAAFVPADAGLSPAQQTGLQARLAAAAHAGYPIRVAIIPDGYDLGSITVLWRRPQAYAEFLAAELSLVYGHALVVVMPDGVGVSLPGHPAADARRVLGEVRIAPGAAGLLVATNIAIDRLLSHADVKVAASPPASASANPGAAASQPARASANPGAVARPPASAPAHPGMHDAAKLALGGALAALFTGALIAVVLTARRRPRPRAALLVAVPALAVLAVGIPIGAVLAIRGHQTAADASQAFVGTPWMLPEGRQPAPGFTLSDQNGHRLSLAAYRGRDVLLTFADPLCRNLCPLEAHVLNALVDQLAPARRPQIIAVSVDVDADARANLRQDQREWGLVPQWHWGVGSRAALASVWRRYAISVEVVNRTLAGTTVHYITHTEASYLIDSAGYERALFAWPFTPRDVLATLRRLG